MDLNGGSTLAEGSRTLPRGSSSRGRAWWAKQGKAAEVFGDLSIKLGEWGDHFVTSPSLRSTRQIGGRLFDQSCGCARITSQRTSVLLRDSLRLGLFWWNLGIIFNHTWDHYPQEWMGWNHQAAFDLSSWGCFTRSARIGFLEASQSWQVLLSSRLKQLKFAGILPWFLWSGSQERLHRCIARRKQRCGRLVWL